MRHILKTLLFAIAFGVAGSATAGEVSRAMFTTSVQDREPAIAVDSINSNAFSSITFFTELNDLEGHNVTHQWSYDGNVMFEKSFEVNGSRWRVWTSKTLLSEWTGTWTVNVLDDDRSVLASRTFEYQ